MSAGRKVLTRKMEEICACSVNTVVLFVRLVTCILNNESNMLGDNVQSLFRYFYQGNSTTDIGTNINIVQGDDSFDIYLLYPRTFGTHIFCTRRFFGPKHLLAPP